MGPHTHYAVPVDRLADLNADIVALLDELRPVVHTSLLNRLESIEGRTRSNQNLPISNPEDFT